MNVLDEFLLKEFECSALYKKKMKNYHDQNNDKFKSSPGDLVLLSSLRLILVKL